MKFVLYCAAIFSSISAAWAEDYKVFYCNYSARDCVKNNETVPMTRSAMMSKARETFTDQNNFFGVVDPQGKILQFYVEGPDKIMLDMPDPPQKGSYQRMTNREEALQILVELKDRLDGYEARLKLVFERWKSDSSE